MKKEGRRPFTKVNANRTGTLTVRLKLFRRAGSPYSWSRERTLMILSQVRSREIPEPSIGVFFALQALDVLTTLLGLHSGAHEGSLFISQLMQMGPLPALLLVKVVATALVLVAFSFKRSRVVVFLNFWFAAVVTWNLGVILTALYSARL